MTEHERSNGHIAFVDEVNIDHVALVEWFERGGELYRAPVKAPVMPGGYRCGRWECSIEHARRFPTFYPFVPKED